MKSLTFDRCMKGVKILLLILVLFNFVTPAFAALEDSFGPLVDKTMLIMKTLAVLFLAYSGVQAMNGNPMLIRPAIIGLILIFGSELIVDFFAGIFGK